MFPEVIGANDTEETNSEEQPLHTNCNKDSNNQTFVTLNSFVPCLGLWAYTWVDNIALPFLLPGTALSRVIKILTDACRKEVTSAEAVTGDGVAYAAYSGPTPQLVCPPNPTKIMSNAKHGLCIFHRLDRNCTSDSKCQSIIAATKQKSIAARTEVDVILRWMCYFSKSCERADEIEVTGVLLSYYLNND